MVVVVVVLLAVEENKALPADGRFRCKGFSIKLPTLCMTTSRRKHKDNLPDLKLVIPWGMELFERTAYRGFREVRNF